MFYFYHPEQNPSNSNYHKGKLFENLLSLYLKALGYSVTLRQKLNSLEYDLTGKSLAGDATLVGEAKAHGRAISGEVISSFVGKLLIPLQSDPHTFGMFLSTSSLTAEGEDFLRSVNNPGSPVRVTSRTGDQLLNDICDKLKLPNEGTTEGLVRALGGFPLSRHMLVLETGPVILQMAAAAEGLTPSHFSLIRPDGAVVGEKALLDDVVAKVPELSELTAFALDSPSKPSAKTQRDVAGRVLLGRDWADYRLPAPPPYFIGRRPLVTKLIAELTGNGHAGVMQVKSRSGVGKSSLLAFLEAELGQAQVDAHLFDARGTKTALDVWSLVQRFCGLATPPTDFRSVEAALQSLAEGAKRRSVLLIDQFESTFTNPELYDAYEFVAITIARLRPTLAMVLARKNDLLTTFDDVEISLDRLNAVSHSLLLDDFTAPEAVELIDRIGSQATKAPSPQVKQYVLEFARGFPWLLKRTMAHILKLSQRPEDRARLLGETLRLDDLFREELEGLDEAERGYLTRIATRLPATYQQLERAFDEDPALRSVIQKLTDTRLLRLTGSTYDTYNDVFKEYLVYKRLPDFRLSFIYKLTPGNVLPAFHKLLPLRRFTNEEVAKQLGNARGTTFNLLHEMRALELVIRDAKGLVIPEAVIEAVEKNRLGDYIRQKLMENGIVSDLMATLQSAGPMERSTLGQHLARQLPFVVASNDTWESYAGILLSWLDSVKLVDDQKDTIALNSATREAAAAAIGNLKIRPRGRRTGAAAFTPTIRPLVIEQAVQEWLAGGLQQVGKNRTTIEKDLLDLGIVSEDGRLLVSSVSEAIKICTSKLLAPPYPAFWDHAKSGRCDLAVIRSFLGLQPLTEQTIEWRCKILVSWGRHLGLLPAGLRVRYLRKK